MPVQPAIPSCLDWLRESESGRAWLAALPAIVNECAARWNLDLGEPYQDSYVSYVLPASRGREPLVLKIQWPHRESMHEASALATWDGNGAIRLIDQDSGSHALLLERCEPGTPLPAVDTQTGLDVMADLLPRLWLPAGTPFGSLDDEVDRWSQNLPRSWAAAGKPFEEILLDEATETLHGLASTQGEQVLIHQDLHGDNVLRSQRERWLAIDPKPLSGEREFGLSPIIRSSEFGHSRDAVLHRLDRLSGALGLDRERARLWAFGHAIAWCFENDRVLPYHVETARWLRDA